MIITLHVIFGSENCQSWISTDGGEDDGRIRGDGGEVGYL